MELSRQVPSPVKARACDRRGICAASIEVFILAAARKAVEALDRRGQLARINCELMSEIPNSGGFLEPTAVIPPLRFLRAGERSSDHVFVHVLTVEDQPAGHGGYCHMPRQHVLTEGHVRLILVGITLA
jgi:hypothetical protein